MNLKRKMGIGQFTSVSEKLRGASRRTLDLDAEDVALHLHDTNVAKVVETLHRSKPRVKTLSLDISRLSTHSEGLDRLIHHISKSACLKTVRLTGSNYKLTATALDAVVKRFVMAIDQNTAIEQLALCNIRLDIEMFVKLLGTSKTLIDLSLVSCSLIGGCRNSKQPCMDKVVDAFRRNTSIEALSLLGLEDSILLPILEAVKEQARLQKLAVSYGSTHAAQAIGDVLQCSDTPRLAHVVLRDSSLTRLEPIVRSMMTRPSVVQRLDVINCDMDPVSASLLRSLFRSRHQRMEHVSFCNIDFEDEYTLEDILHGVRGSPTIKRLKLHHANLRSRDYKALTDLLHKNKHLERVDLDRQILSVLAKVSNVTVPCDKAFPKFVFSRKHGTLERRSSAEVCLSTMHKNGQTI